MKHGSRVGILAGTLGTLVLSMACTVGEAQPVRPEPSDGPGDSIGAAPGNADPGSPEAPAVMGGWEDPSEYQAMDLLVRAQLAYNAGELSDALTTAEQVLQDHAGSSAVEPARWVAARAAFSIGDYDRARRMALAYAEGQPESAPLAREARDLAVLAEDGMATPAARAPVLGVVLPRTGPRVLVRYADFVLEGIELAVAEARQTQRRPIELVVADDSGGARIAEAVAELERRGALAIVGPLLPRHVYLAAAARRDRRLVLVSPTATRRPEWRETYSVGTGDTRGAQQLGRYAADVGLQQAALLHARGESYEEKALAFAVEYEALGGEVKALVPYDSGTTTFGPHMGEILEAVAPAAAEVDSAAVDRLITLGFLPDREAADTMVVDSLQVLVDLLARFDSAAGAVRDAAVDPDTSDPWLGRPRQKPFALFVAGPRQDIPKIAPQVAFYDLDSAGVQVFGDEAWTAADIRRVVPRRDLEGVIAASHFPPDRADGPADPEFVEAYEERYRRSLDNPLPALGYDATTLILRALPNQLLNPDALARRFGFLAGIRGATGLLSVRAGEVVRTPYLVIIHQGGLRPAPFPWEYELPEPLPPKPDSTDLEEEAGR